MVTPATIFARPHGGLGLWGMPPIMVAPFTILPRYVVWMVITPLARGGPPLVHVL